VEGRGLTLAFLAPPPSLAQWSPSPSKLGEEWFAPPPFVLSEVEAHAPDVAPGVAFDFAQAERM